MTKEELYRSLEETVDRTIALRLALDDGELVFTNNRLYFIAIRMDSWIIVEQWERKSISKWRLIDSFMGQELAIFTPDGRFLFRKVPADINWPSLFQGGSEQNIASRATPIPPEDKTVHREASESYSYQESASEMVDLLSKHVSYVDSKKQELSDIVQQPSLLSEKLREKKQLSSRRNRDDASIDEFPAPAKKKGGGCVSAFAFVIMVIFFSDFLNEMLSCL